MFTFSEPSAAQVEDFLDGQKDLPFSYAEVGASKDAAPKGYPINHRRVCLGRGREVFARAENAVRNWAMYQLDWTRLYPPKTPLEVGAVVCVVVNHGFCWSLNPCRVIYLTEEKGDVRRFGFAFGTLPGHSETGEERFTVEWHQADDSVWYELFAFARPHDILAKIGFPFVGYFQRAFAADSSKAMQKSVGEKDW